MRWQAPVKTFAVMTVSLFFFTFNSMAADRLLPPLLDDPQQNAENPQQRPCRFTGDFQQERIVEDLVAPLVSMGSFLFICDRGLLWEVRKPIVDNRVYSIEKLNFRIRKNRKVTQLKGIAESRTATLLLDFLSGNTEALAEDFDLLSDSPEFVVLRPRKKSVRKRLTQMIVEQQGNTVRITIQFPASGDIVLSIDNIASIEDEDLNAACQKFSQQPRPNCQVLTRAKDFIGTQKNPSQ
ncbi:MAG: outer membrane lipoprotein carrier protein LolA [Granulosicoccus sp.]